MKNSYIFPNKKISVRRLALFYILQISVLSGLAAEFSICLFIVCLPRVAFVEVYEENLVLYKYILGKGRSILIAFQHNCKFVDISTILWQT